MGPALQGECITHQPVIPDAANGAIQAQAIHSKAQDAQHVKAAAAMVGHLLGNHVAQHEAHKAAVVREVEVDTWVSARMGMHVERKWWQLHMMSTPRTRAALGARPRG